MLIIENLQASYGRIPVLHNVSLTVGTNEIVSIIGANGAGKSTLLRAISGLVAANGQINLDGENVVGYSPDRRVKSGISLVPEGRHLFQSLSVKENLVLGAYSRWTAKEEIVEDIEFVYSLFPRLKERLNQRSGSLSGGEQQMLAIGRAIMSSPKLLLLDEPSTGLAPILVNEIYGAMCGDLYQQGIAILIVEQYARIALRYASRGCVMERGKLIFGGTSQELLDNGVVKRSYLGMD